MHRDQGEHQIFDHVNRTEATLLSVAATALCKSNSRCCQLYSNRVAVVVEQPAKIKFPFGSYTSEVPAELNSVPFEANAAS